MLSENPVKLVSTTYHEHIPVSNADRVTLQLLERRLRSTAGTTAGAAERSRDGSIHAWDDRQGFQLAFAYAHEHRFKK